MPLLGSILHINDLKDASVSLNGNTIEYGEVVLTTIDIAIVFLIVYILLMYVFKPYILQIKRDHEEPNIIAQEQNEEIITQLTNINNQNKNINSNLEDLKHNLQ